MDRWYQILSHHRFINNDQGETLFFTHKSLLPRISQIKAPTEIEAHWLFVHFRPGWFMESIREISKPCDGFEVGDPHPDYPERGQVDFVTWPFDK